MQYQELGYDTYDEFLRGSEWTQIRDIKYKAKGAYLCRLCHKDSGLSLHKRTYFNLTPEFFLALLKHRPRMFYAILVYLCGKCNRSVHFYRSGEKVPLDYLFLWDREQSLYFRPDNVILRIARSVRRILIWIYRSYYIPQNKR